MMLRDSLLLLGGHNATLVTVGSCMLGVAAGVAGTFLYLRRRALLSDAVAHSTLPGVCVAFVVMAHFGGDGRNLAGLLLGAAVAAALGLHIVQWMTRKTRLGEDTAIGTVLSVSFGVGIVLLTAIQNMGVGRPAGLEGFLLGSTAGMLMSEAWLIAVSGAAAVLAVAALRRPLAMAAFDPGHAASVGVPVSGVDWAMMALVTAVTVIGLKVAGLVLIVALLIIPPVAARFWTERTHRVVAFAGAFGGLAGYFGAALSASAPNLPAGPIIVLVAFAIFVFSLLFAPARGALATLLRRRRFRMKMRMRQALADLAAGGLASAGADRALLLRAGFVGEDGAPTPAGMAEAVRVLRDERRWRAARSLCSLDGVLAHYDGLTPSEAVMTASQLDEVDRRLGEPGRAPA